MKEYEYVMEAVEGYLCDQLTSVICSENYQNKSHDPAYLRIFREYWKLHEAYEADHERFEDPALEEDVRRELQDSYEKKRKDIQTSFLKDLRAYINDPDFPIEEWRSRYLERLESEDTQTVAKHICLYPYLASALKECRKGEEKSDGERL